LDDFLSREQEEYKGTLAAEAGKRLAARLARQRQVGDVLKLDYNEATIVVHDRLRRDVGGLPLGCFLVATRVEPGSAPDPDQEDTSLILLRVLGPSQLPNHLETDRDRFEAAKRAADRAEQWDDQTTTDQFTLNLLRFAGLHCRILGTFLLKPNATGDWDLTFGPDLANFYSGRGMKVYKPDSQTLAAIVNFVRPQTEWQLGSGHRIEIGRVRYAASERSGDDTARTRVDLDPADLLARRTALFGMSRTGKSNTTKVVAAAVFGLRAFDDGVRVGQLILDPNGEYANDNVQDAGSLRGIAGRTAGARDGDVVTYGLHSHPNDPTRRIIKLNFFGNEPQDWRDRDQVVDAMTGLIQGKEILNNLLSDQDGQYISDFRNQRLDVPEDWDDSARTRHMRLVSAYRALLSEHLQPPAFLRRARLGNLTNPDLRTALSNDAAYATAAIVFSQADSHWNEARSAWQALGRFINTRGTGYGAFNRSYAAKHNGRDWHDSKLMSVLHYLNQLGGMRLISRVIEYHSPNSITDYADDIVADLRAGRLVIVDQSTGDPDMNKAAGERLMWRVFNRQRQDFIHPRRTDCGAIVPPPDILAYVEEAHNLLPAKTDDLTKVWSRVAKEGSKFRIGLLYATQEPSSIQTNILKNTDNWFVAHLNNADELRELKKYYDFEDFSQQILGVSEPGFLRMRTLSNPYTVPVQVDRFTIVP
jgi:DNA helicase HerA-like ATPase